MMRLRNEFDRLLDESFDFPEWRWPEFDGGVALDVAEKDDTYIIKASIPGLQPEDLDVSITDNILTIKGETKKEETLSEEQYHLRERRYGAFARSVTLPTSVDSEAVEATYEDGVLTLNAPKTEDMRRKRIKVSSVQSSKMIEGETG